jgi:leucine-rich repeat-containing protein 49
MASFHVTNSSPAGRRDPKPAGRLAALFISHSNSRSQSEPGILGPAGRRYSLIRVQPAKPPDLMPQGKALNLGKSKPPPSAQKPPDIARKSHAGLIASEEDERYRYLLKHGNVKKVEDEDKILYAELPQIPGVLVVYRKPSERLANPERLNLDRRELAHLPLLEGEEKLRLLNFQHNAIAKIENLVSLPSLIFLDLYSNQIREISGLHTVPTLRVLMLGKNLIDKIKNLQYLTKLDVLDLHSNQITAIEGVSHLTELRVLNLANNQIALIESLSGLVSLTELNLRRNKIEVVSGVDGLPKLQRLFLSNNKIATLEAVSALGKCLILGELSLDGNPVAAFPGYNQCIEANCQALKILDATKISREGRESPQKTTKPQLSAGQEQPPALQSAGNPVILATIEQEWKQEIERLRAKGLNSFRRRKDLQTECQIQTGNAEIEGETHLFLYGNALEVLQKPEFRQAIQHITFRYIRFDLLTQQNILSELRHFPNLRSISLLDNNIHSFTHLSKLESLSGLTALYVENNDVCCSVLCRSFVIYRFPLIGEVMGSGVSEVDRTRAKQQFQQFDKVLSAPNLFSPKLFVGEDKELQKIYRMKQKKNSDFATDYVSKLLTNAVQTEAKIALLTQSWSDLVLSVAKKTTQELSHPNHISELTLLDKS